jgi:two-component system cell cycle sensor histidine kinase/response regulator CckA
MKANPPSGREKILLVEDDTDVRTFMREVLKESGYHIWEASDCSEALDIWKANAPQIDLLLADLSMPGGLNGRELAEKLRRERPGLKVILMSGYVPDTAEASQCPGCFLQKPFSPESLTEMVRSHLGSARLTG